MSSFEMQILWASITSAAVEEGAGKSGFRQTLQLITEHSDVLEPPTDIQSLNEHSHLALHVLGLC